MLDLKKDIRMKIKHDKKGYLSIYEGDKFLKYVGKSRETKEAAGIDVKEKR